MKQRIKVAYSLSQSAIDFVAAVAEAADCSRSQWLTRTLDRMATGGAPPPTPPSPTQPKAAEPQAAPAPVGIPTGWVRVTLVESDAGKVAYMSPEDAGVADGPTAQG